MSRRGLITIVILLSLVLGSGGARGEVPGSILLLENCPGDKLKAKQTKDEAAFMAAALTPLITAVVTQGLKAWGGQLKASAVEANVDVVHASDYVYVWSGEASRLRYTCWIVTSKGTRRSSRTLDELVKGYQKREIELDENARPTGVVTPGDGSEVLKAKLAAAGYAGRDKLPATLIVFDVELSATKGDARLVPRFVSLDHSIREWFWVSRPRTITVEFSLTTPGSAQAFGAPAIKLDGLRVGVPVDLSTKGPERVSSNWFPLPELDTKTTATAAALKEAQAAKATEEEAARLAGDAARNLGAVGLDYLPKPLCLGPETVETKLIETNSKLVAEQIKPNPDPAKVALFTQLKTYYDSCQKVDAANQKIQRNTLKDGSLGRTFDITATFKEFRKRPFAEFFGNVLSDADAQKGMTSAVVGAIDPATRAAARETRRTAATAAQEAYETAVIAAEAAIVAHESAAANERAAKYIDMEAKKRAANRKAAAAGISQPYPGSGTWFSARD